MFESFINISRKHQEHYSANERLREPRTINLDLSPFSLQSTGTSLSTRRAEQVCTKSPTVCTILLDTRYF